MQKTHGQFEPVGLGISSSFWFSSLYLPLFIVPMAMPVSLAIAMPIAVSVVFVLAVMVPVVVPVLFAHPRAPEVLLPAEVPAPVGSLASSWQIAPVTKPRIEVAIYIPAEALRPVKPRSRTEEHPTHKPLRAVIANGCTGIRRVIEVPVGANRRHPNPDVDVDLSCCLRCRSSSAKTGKNRHDQKPESLH